MGEVTASGLESSGNGFRVSVVGGTGTDIALSRSPAEEVNKNMYKTENYTQLAC